MLSDSPCWKHFNFPWSQLPPLNKAASTYVLMEKLICPLYIYIYVYLYIYIYCIYFFIYIHINLYVYIFILRKLFACMIMWIMLYYMRQMIKKWKNWKCYDLGCLSSPTNHYFVASKRGFPLFWSGDFGHSDPGCVNGAHLRWHCCSMSWRSPWQLCANQGRWELRVPGAKGKLEGWFGWSFE